MARSRRFGGRRLRAAFVVVGITLGILLLFFLQFALPYFLGPVGLLAAGILDAGILLELHHRRAVRRRRRTGAGIVAGPASRRDPRHARRWLDDEIAATVAFLVFVLGISVESLGLPGGSGSPGTSVVLYFAGSAIVLIAAAILNPYAWRASYWISESEKYDTTDDR